MSISRFFRDERGVSAVELGVSLPILVMLTVGAVDVSNLVSARLDLEQAAQRTTDLALARHPKNSDGGYLIAEAAAASGQSTNNIEVEIFLECDGERQASYGATCDDTEERARFASVAISTNYEPIFNYRALGSLFGRHMIDSSIRITGDSVVRFQ